MMTIKVDRKKRYTILALSGVFVILVIFPLISLKYLNKGLDYRQSQLATLDSLGAVPPFIALNDEGKELSPKELRGKVTIFGIEDMLCDEAHQVTLEEYLSKFIEQDDFRYVVITTDSCTFRAGHYFTDPQHSQRLRSFFSAQVDDVPAHLALADRDGMVRRFYNITRKEDLESLVAHTSLVMPAQKRRR